jgi:hypothetical protein
VPRATCHVHVLLVVRGPGAGCLVLVLLAAGCALRAALRTTHYAIRNALRTAGCLLPTRPAGCWCCWLLAAGATRSEQHSSSAAAADAAGACVLVLVLLGSPYCVLPLPPCSCSCSYLGSSEVVTGCLVALLPQLGVGQQVNGTRPRGLSTRGRARGGAAAPCIRMPHATAYLMRR